MIKYYDLIIIGGGPAGLAAGIEAKKNGIDKVLIIERDKELGGILPQCIHNGFGSVIFKKDYPGPYYIQKFIDEVYDLKIEVLLDTMVFDITASKKVYASSCSHGYQELHTKAIVLAMGCRERTRAQVKIPGSRPAGIFTAGTVQRMVNIEGYVPGNKFVILGSGDIGMIMARRLTLEGAKIERVVELMPFLTGLRRNYVQCLQDFDIKLDLSHTIKRVIGKNRVEAVEVVKVDECFNIVEGTEEVINCDAFLLSVGLIPENELSKRIGIDLNPVTGGPVIDDKMETNIEGVFAAGNVVFIHDLVDYVTRAGYAAGKNAADYIKNGKPGSQKKIKILKGDNVHSIIPDFIACKNDKTKTMFQFRVSKPFEKQVLVEFLEKDKVIFKHKLRYARPAEMINLEIDFRSLNNSLNCKEIMVRVSDL